MCVCVCGARRYNLYYLFRQHMNFKARAKFIRTAAEFHKSALRRKQRERVMTFSRVKHEDVTERRPDDSERRQRRRRVTSSRPDEGDLCSARVNKHQS